MKIKEGYVIEKVGTSYLAVAVGESAVAATNMVRLNSTGAFLWNCLTEADLTHDELVDKVATAYEVERSAIEKDIVAFENQLITNGILE